MDIRTIEEYITKRGNISKNKCVIGHEKLGSIIVEQSYKEIYKAKYDRMIIKGFVK